MRPPSELQRVDYCSYDALFSCSFSLNYQLRVVNPRGNYLRSCACEWVTGPVPWLQPPAQGSLIAVFLCFPSSPSNTVPTVPLAHKLRECLRRIKVPLWMSTRPRSTRGCTPANCKSHAPASRLRLSCPFSFLDTYWAMKVCTLTLVKELYRWEINSHETYGCFKRSDRRIGWPGR